MRLWSARTRPRFGPTRHVASRKAATCCRTPKAMSCHRTPRQLPQLSHGASATPLSHARKSSASSLFPVRPKAPSPLPLCRRTAKSSVRKAVFDGFLKFRPFLPVFPACNATVLACTAFELGCMAMMQTCNGSQPTCKIKEHTCMAALQTCNASVPICTFKLQTCKDGDQTRIIRLLTCITRLLTCITRLLTCITRLLTCITRLLTCITRLLTCSIRLLTCKANVLTCNATMQTCKQAVQVCKMSDFDTVLSHNGTRGTSCGKAVPGRICGDG